VTDYWSNKPSLPMSFSLIIFTTSKIIKPGPKVIHFHSLFIILFHTKLEELPNSNMGHTRKPSSTSGHRVNGQHKISIIITTYSRSTSTLLFGCWHGYTVRSFLLFFIWQCYVTMYWNPFPCNVTARNAKQDSPPPDDRYVICERPLVVPIY